MALHAAGGGVSLPTYFLLLTPLTICHSPPQAFRPFPAWVHCISPRRISMVAGSGFAASSRCAFSGLRFTVHHLRYGHRQQPLRALRDAPAAGPAERRRRVHRRREHVVNHHTARRDAQAGSCAFAVSALKMEADRPNGDCFASDTALSMVSKGITAATGTNTPRGRLRRLVGC